MLITTMYANNDITPRRKGNSSGDLKASLFDNNLPYKNHYERRILVPECIICTVSKNEHIHIKVF